MPETGTAPDPNPLPSSSDAPPVPPTHAAVLSEPWWRENFATILVSVIAMVATLSSAGIAFVATYQQAASSRQQGDNDFRRNVRKEAYGGVLGAVEALTQAELELRPNLALLHPETTQRWADKMRGRSTPDRGASTEAQ